MALPFPLEGRTLVAGPTNTGKTTLTADALRAWVETHGTEGVVVLDFAPELERDGELLGGRLDRFVELPEDVWTGMMDAYAPRAAGADENEAYELAAVNARNAAELFAAAPEPRAVFVNDATIPFQSDVLDAHVLTEYCAPADAVVCNAFDGDELGSEDLVSRFEREAIEALRAWADRVEER